MRFFERTTLLQFDNHDRNAFIMPGEAYEYEFEMPERDFPRSLGLRIVGETDIFWKWRQESGVPYYISMSIEDTLTTRDTYREKFAMRIPCNGEDYPRNAYLKLNQHDFPKGMEYHFEVYGKAENLEIAGDGEALVELGIYKAQPARHPNDTYDLPDEVIQLKLRNGTYDWEKFSLSFIMPEDAVALLLRIGVRRASGVVMFGSARLYPAGMDNVIPPLDRQQSRRPQYNYLGENLSRRDWPEFLIKVDGETVFHGQKYTAIYRRPYFEIPLPVLSSGKHRLSIRLQADYESATGFILQQLDLLEYGNHDFEIIAAPEFLGAGEACRIFLKTNTDHAKITANGVCHEFHHAGHHVLTIPPLEPGLNYEVKLKSQSHEDSFVIKQVTEGSHDGVYLSSGDSIFINRNSSDFMPFLEWYLQNRIGNAICFRQSYRWGGDHGLKPEFWREFIPLVNQLGMVYSLMIDGRELPGMTANPPDSLLAGEYYHGRQAHENDGSFYYWANRMWGCADLNDPYADILARGVDKGGIQPHVRPKRKGNRAWWFFDPTDAENMKEAATAFVANLADAKGESTRHSGPSALFRYFFQAGYKYLLAEQMYGPEEVILAALRGASRAYGTDQYGAHLAAQWSSAPHDTPEHAERYWLSLATCYMQGVSEINLEEGLWRMESQYADYDRFSRNCLKHLEAHTRFRRHMQTHRRRGAMNVPIAVIQGRYDGWCCFTRQNVWCREGDYWQFGAPEASFDLLGVFYPRSKFNGIYCSPCPVAPQGWYTGTPYGPVDLAPFETAWQRYQAVIFLGWHTYEQGDGAKMLEYVRNGGILLLARPHLSDSADRRAFNHTAEPELLELLEKNYLDETGILKRQVGSGKIIYFADNCYPSQESINAEYRQAMAEIAEQVITREKEKAWVKANEDVNYAVYDQADGSRVIYLLNIRWWDNLPSEVTLMLGQNEYRVSVPPGNIHSIMIYGITAIMSANPVTDIISFNGSEIRLQSSEPGRLLVWYDGAFTDDLAYAAGISVLQLDH